MQFRTCSTSRAISCSCGVAETSTSLACLHPHPKKKEHVGAFRRLWTMGTAPENKGTRLDPEVASPRSSFVFLFYPYQGHKTPSNLVHGPLRTFTDLYNAIPYHVDVNAEAPCDLFSYWHRQHVIRMAVSRSACMSIPERRHSLPATYSTVRPWLTPEALFHSLEATLGSA